jgi:hypothetical protein
MYASDFPHDHGPSANILCDVLDEEARSAALFRTASALYGLGD